MTKAKKVLSLVLAVVMVAAMFAFSASAATENATFTVSVDKTPVTVGEEITVTVNLETDYYTASTNVPVYYDPAVFEFVAGSVVATPIFGAGTTGVVSYNDAATGCLKVGFYPDTTAGDATAQFMNGTLFTFKLRAIANGTSDIALHAEDQKSATNVGGTLYCGAYASSVPDNNPATVGQAFTINNTTATVGATATPELQLSEYGATMGAVIDRVRCTSTSEFSGCVYGIDTLTGASLSDYLTTPAGSVVVIPNDEYGAESTGATIQLLDESGTVLETYVFIVFGDINGDCAVDGSDISLADAHDGYLEMLEDDTFMFYAGDITADGAVDGSDISVIDAYDAYVEDLPSQADVAAALVALA